MGYTTSPNDNEALSAMRMANGILMQSNLTWEQFISQKTIVVQEIVQDIVQDISFKKPLDVRIVEKLEACLRGVKSASGREFISSLNRQYREDSSLSKRQLEALDNWYARL
jgi:hypothetical protein